MVKSSHKASNLHENAELLGCYLPAEVRTGEKERERNTALLLVDCVYYSSSQPAAGDKKSGSERHLAPVTQSHRQPERWRRLFGDFFVHYKTFVAKSDNFLAARGHCTTTLSKL